MENYLACPFVGKVIYRIERVFDSLDAFLLMLPRFLLRPLVLRRQNAGIARLLDTIAGRIRYDYLERLQSSMIKFEIELAAAVTMVTESLRSALRRYGDRTRLDTAVLNVLDSVIRDCSQLRTET